MDSQGEVGSCGCGSHAVADPACLFFGRARGDGIADRERFRADIGCKSLAQKQRYLLTEQMEQAQHALAKSVAWVLQGTPNTSWNG